VAIPLASTASGACDLAPGSAAATADERKVVLETAMPINTAKSSGSQQRSCVIADPALPCKSTTGQFWMATLVQSSGLCHLSGLRLN
jgi:hypothetical protein